MLRFSHTLRLCAVVTLFAFAGCEGQSTPTRTADRNYAADARQAYEDAILDFRNDNCLDAEPAFRRIRREFAYTRYAALAELRIGDCQIEQSGYTEAIQTFRTFIRRRPTHSQVPYARFRIAEAHYAQIPSDWFIVPPSWERDLEVAHDALRLLRQFVLRYPEDENVTRANEMIERALFVLARHELYAAEYYFGQRAYAGVIRRIQTLLRRYDGSGLEPEALVLLGRTYERIEDEAQARLSYEEALARGAEEEQAESARRGLERLGVEPGSAPAPRPAVDTSGGDDEGDADGDDAEEDLDEDADGEGDASADDVDGDESGDAPVDAEGDDAESDG